MKRSGRTSSSATIDLIERWIRAEYYCRRPHLLPEHLRGEATWALIQAEEELRQAVTGERDLVDAARSLGLKTEPIHHSRMENKPLRKLKRLKKKPKVKAKPTRRKPRTIKGFFD